MYLEIVVFLIFLSLSILSGFYTSFRATTLNQYAVGSKALTTSTIASSITVIMYGGAIFYHPLDLNYLLILTGSAISYFIIAYLIPPRLHIFSNVYSVAEIMGKLYGKQVRKLVAICGILSSTTAGAMHLKLCSIAMSRLLNINESYSLVAATVIVMLMIQSGNIESLTLLHVLRCATFVIVIPTLAWVIWKVWLAQYHTKQAELILGIKNSWSSWLNFSKSSAYYITCFFVFAIPTLHPTEIHRVLIAENALQIKRSFNYAGLFSLCINLILLWIGLLSNGAFNSLVIIDTPTRILHTYIGLQGCLVAGVAALAISAATAHLHSATVLVMHDVAKIFKYTHQPSINPKSYTTIVGIISMLFALHTTRPFELFALATLLFKSSASIPFLMALMGINLHRYAVLVGMLASGITIAFWQYFYLGPFLNSLAPSMLVNLVTISLVQLGLNKHEKKEHYTTLMPPSTEESNMRSYKERWSATMRSILFTCKTFKLFNYIQKQFPKNNTLYILFSFYMLITNYCSFYTFSSSALHNSILEYIILFPSLFVAAFFLFYASIVPGKYIARAAALIWQLSNLYFLWVVGVGMLWLSNFAHLQVIIIMVNLTLSILTTSYMLLSIRLLLTAIVLYILLPFLGHDLATIDTFFNINISFIYVILMTFVFIGGVLYYKENLRKSLVRIQDLKVEKKNQSIRQSFRKQQLEVLSHESSYIITHLHDQLPKLLHNKGDLMMAIAEQATKLKRYFHSLFTYLKHNLYLTLNLVNIEQLLQDCFDSILIKNIYDYPYIVINTENSYIQCDEEQIKNLIINSLIACNLLGPANLDGSKKDIYIYINDTHLGYRLTFLEGKMERIAAISLVITTNQQRPILPAVYKVTETANFEILHKKKKTQHKHTAFEQQHIIHAHYGYSEIIQTDTSITHIYVIPVHLQHVIKTFTMLAPVISSRHVVLDTTSIEAESTFLEKVKEKKWLNIDVIENILELIKINYTSQRRKTGDLFYLHPIVVASILLDITEHPNLIIAGLTHDLVQNTPLTQAGFATIIGEDITQMVGTARSFEQELPRSKIEYPKYIQYIIHHKCHDAIRLRLADVLHNAQTLYAHNPQKQIAKAKIIQRFYVPLAKQMQLAKIAYELRFHAAKILS